MPETSTRSAPQQPRRVHELRSAFIDFFKARGGDGDGHTFVPSSPSAPLDDPTLLFTNAGMNQFKPIFLGQVEPGSPLAGLKRAVNSQKCIRAGGKHNDLEDVGADTYHHTFFEMLGNWSFGDYFKAEAIEWAWEFLTDTLGLPADRLYVTYFEGDPEAGLEPDHEARDLWLRHLPPERVLPGSFKDNFWEMGDTGPCGPCSEIHFDRIGSRDASSLVNADDPDVIELWNLVFIQFDRQAIGGDTASGTRLVPLPQKHVDTGMGLERLASVIQGVRSNYDTDAFKPLIHAVEALAGGVMYGGRTGNDDPDRIDTAFRVIADHVRTLTIAIADGCTPGNEGRGYVLRRILRRAVRYGRQMLELPDGFMAELSAVVISEMGGSYPELRTHRQRIIDIILDEEQSFGRTLDRGIQQFEEECFKLCRDYTHSVVEPRWQTMKDRIAALQMLLKDSDDTLYSLHEELSDVQRNADITMDTFWLHMPGDGWTSVRQDIETLFYPDIDRLIEICDSIITKSHADAITRAAQEARDSFALTGKEIRTELAHLPPLAGEDAFKLYDTYGFPIDLTVLMARERGIEVDINGFHRSMEEQRERSRAGAKGDTRDRMQLDTAAIESLRKADVPPTDDSHKHAPRELHAEVLAIWDGEQFVKQLHTRGPKTEVGVILDRTCYYAEAGGQIADTGDIVVEREPGTSERHQTELHVAGVRNHAGYILHACLLPNGKVHVGDSVHLRVDTSRRRHIAANHTATHLLNEALRRHVSPDTDQKGSLVAPDRLRFDFAHAKPVTPEQSRDVEADVNRAIEQNLTVYADTAPLALAQRIAGLRAVFGEKYPDPVRIVSIGVPIADLIQNPGNEKWAEYSVEFCGGTHLRATGEAETFALVSETGIAKGIRRVEALTGVPAIAAHKAADGLDERVKDAESLEGDQLQAEVADIAGEIDQLTLPIARKHDIRQKLAKLQDRLKARQKEAAAARRGQAVEAARALAQQAQDGTEPFIVGTLDLGDDRQALQSALKTVSDACPGRAIMLLSADAEAGRVALLAAVPPDQVGKGLKAGDWIRTAAQACGGKGGGKPEQAQGGGTEPDKLDEATDAARRFAKERLA